MSHLQGESGHISPVRRRFLQGQLHNRVASELAREPWGPLCPQGQAKSSVSHPVWGLRGFPPRGPAPGASCSWRDGEAEQELWEPLTWLRSTWAGLVTDRRRLSGKPGARTLRPGPEALRC